MPVCLKAVARCALAAALLSAAGCGVATARVRGKVTHGGKAVVYGSVALADRTGAIHNADIDPDGNYQIDGVPPGPVKFAVVSPNPEGHRAPGDDRVKAGRSSLADPREQTPSAREKHETPGKPRPAAGAWFPIPAKYNRPDSSGLAGEVSGKETVIDLDLK